ncbi:MAG: twin-arginine translocase TatA/TatE family subunit [Anaeromyxobacter sp.]|nr:twin-arginine translocase TatA/TatE family subunit [Anaeromyxobacter sp.]MBL0276147.1 twin-arginine translocase TatA/TatE family subunit [Anaeromyxobacter sp.]
MFGLRMPELLIIGFIVVLLFGANKLPALGAGLGNGIRSFKKAFSGDDDKLASKDEKPQAGEQGPKA